MRQKRGAKNKEATKEIGNQKEGKLFSCPQSPSNPSTPWQPPHPRTLLRTPALAQIITTGWGPFPTLPSGPLGVSSRSPMQGKKASPSLVTVAPGDTPTHQTQMQMEAHAFAYTEGGEGAAPCTSSHPPPPLLPASHRPGSLPIPKPGSARPPFPSLRGFWENTLPPKREREKETKPTLPRGSYVRTHECLTCCHNPVTSRNPQSEHPMINRRLEPGSLVKSGGHGAPRVVRLRV